LRNQRAMLMTRTPSSTGCHAVPPHLECARVHTDVGVQADDATGVQYKYLDGDPQVLAETAARQHQLYVTGADPGGEEWHGQVPDFGLVLAPAGAPLRVLGPRQGVRGCSGSQGFGR
jgi:hypothetical protein